MSKINVIIEKSHHNYSAYIDGVDGISVTGESLDEIRTRITEAVSFYIDGCNDMGAELPDEFKDEYSFNFCMDVESFLKFYEGILSKSGLERLAGVNQKQLWHYASGGRKPRKEVTERLEKAIHKLGEELLSIQL